MGCASHYTAHVSENPLYVPGSFRFHFFIPENLMNPQALSFSLSNARLQYIDPRGLLTLFFQSDLSGSRSFSASAFAITNSAVSIFFSWKFKVIPVIFSCRFQFFFLNVFLRPVSFFAWIWLLFHRFSRFFFSIVSL